MLNHFYRSSAEKELGKIIKARHSAVCLPSPPGKGVGWGGKAVRPGKRFAFFYSMHYKAPGRAPGTEFSSPFLKATRYRGL